jgi:hypothetical protein
MSFTQKSNGADVHILPDDDKHIASPSCWCHPVEDEKTKHLRAQGFPTARVWVHFKPS